MNDPGRRHRKSGRVPKGERPIEGLEPLTHDALDAAVFIQNRAGPTRKPKSRELGQIATDLELAIIDRKPKETTDRLCLNVAALALRILEQGD
jgi:hypothetical protein